ncbi:MAG: tetratricopeptide repeat protein [Planctomycetota bacterium]
MACSGCAGLGAPDAPPVHRHVTGASTLVAAICAQIVRSAHPEADERPYAPGAAALDLGGGDYRIELVDEIDGAQRLAGDCRLTVRALDEAPDLLGSLDLRVERQDAPRAGTAAPARGRLLVTVEARPDGAEVTVQTSGTLGAAEVVGRLDATLSLVDDVRRCRRDLLAGDCDAALDTIRSGVDALQQSRDAIDPRWLAEAHLALAAAQLATGHPGEARDALDRAVQLAPDRADARRHLAGLLRTHALPLSAARHDRTLGATLGLGFTSLCRQVRVATERPFVDEAARPWLATAAAHLRAGDLDGARRYAMQARGHEGSSDAAALGLLGSIAEAGGDDRLAGELRLAQALVAGFSPDVRLVMSRIRSRQGHTGSAVRWLGEAWHEVAPLAAARAQMRDLLLSMDADTATRLLATTRTDSLAGPFAAASTGASSSVTHDAAAAPPRQ